MRRASWMILALALGVGGCESDFSIDEPAKAVGNTNPPDLSSPTKTDQIVQVTTPQVDILWVIDDSCSMSEEQAKLTNNFDAFINFFLDSGLDWHIGVVSTDTNANDKKGKLQGAAGYKYLDPDTPNPIALFQQMAVLGTGGAIDERGRRATHMALTDPQLSGFNAGFYREDASLNVVVISDENDSSGSNPTRNEFINFLQTLKEDPELVSFSSIVGPQGGCATADPGTEYIAVTNAVGGIHESICKSDWVPVLEQLGLQAAGLRREYFLSEIPVPGTIEVWVVDGNYEYNGLEESLVEDGEAFSEACQRVMESENAICFPFTYDASRNSILMEDFVPSPLAEINISYELLAGYQPGEGDDPLGELGGSDDTGM